jgi:hypothetical protein
MRSRTMQPTGEKRTSTRVSKPNGRIEPATAHLIRIPDRADRERALVGFLRVAQTRCRFSDNRFLVSWEHIEVLRAAGIPFEEITESHS